MVSKERFESEIEMGRKFVGQVREVKISRKTIGR